MPSSFLSRSLAVLPVLAVSFGVGALSAPTGASAAAPHSSLRPVARTDSVGLYTVEQAERGEQVFKKVCYECHEVEDLTNEDFRFEWDGRSVCELYELVRTTMPDENPGTLSREQYLDAIAYVLKINNQPAGPAEFVGDSASSSVVMLKLSDKEPAAAPPDTLRD